MLSTISGNRNADLNERLRKTPLKVIAKVVVE